MTAVPRPAGLGRPWRAARRAGATSSSRPGSSGFILFILGPMIATLVFTFTNVTLAQDEPLRFVGIENYSQFLGDQQA